MFILLYCYEDCLGMNIKMPTSGLIPAPHICTVHDGLSMGVNTFFLGAILYLEIVLTNTDI